ncbi:MAG: ABC transporter substrate-binding protein [Deltaproteobacteria bacterium]|nr:ABC transporter substrate-binding protein [Deltaproteobacteria bacterium]
MKRWFIACVVALSMVFLLSPCTPQAASPAAKQDAVKSSKDGGVMTILITRPATRFGYPPAIAGPDRDYAPPFFNRLLYIGDDGKYKPELALSWNVSADGKAITFKLRQGVKFHDGTDFNAAAVKFNFDKLIAPNPIIIDGIASVDIVDSYTVRVSLTNYNNLILYQIASSYACYMYSPTALQKNGPDWANTHPVGTGPFMLKEFQPTTSMTYAKNPNYWDKGLPHLDQIRIASIQNPMTQLVTFKAGQANAIYDAVPTTAAQLRDAGFKLLNAPGALYTLSFDAKNSEAFGKVKVRQAIEYAVDKEAICNGPGLGLYKPIYQIVTSNSPDYNKSLTPRKYNPEMAKKLLAEAGYPNGFSFRGFFQDNTWKDGVVAVQSYLAKVGIKMEIIYINSAAYSAIRALGKIEKGAAAQATMNVFSNNLFLMDFYFRSDSAIFQYMTRPAGSDKLIDQAKLAKDQASATKINQQIAKLVYDDATVVPLWLNPRIVVLDKTVQDPGWFLNDDSNNNMFGFETWLKK